MLFWLAFMRLHVCLLLLRGLFLLLFLLLLSVSVSVCLSLCLCLSLSVGLFVAEQKWFC